jgi:hypothetical protein
MMGFFHDYMLIQKYKKEAKQLDNIKTEEEKTEEEKQDEKQRHYRYLLDNAGDIIVRMQESYCMYFEMMNDYDKTRSFIKTEVDYSNTIYKFDDGVLLIFIEETIDIPLKSGSYHVFVYWQPKGYAIAVYKRKFGMCPEYHNYDYELSVCRYGDWLEHFSQLYDKMLIAEDKLQKEREREEKRKFSDIFLRDIK